MKFANLTTQQWAKVDQQQRMILWALHRLGKDAKVELWPNEDGRCHMSIFAYNRNHTRTWATHRDTRPDTSWCMGNPDAIAKDIVEKCGGMAEYPFVDAYATTR